MNGPPTARGAYVSLATSSDVRFPPESVIDGNPTTFWMTTGLFPQELIISFSNLTSLSAISTKTANVRRMVIKSSNQTEGSEFDTIIEKELPAPDGRRAQNNVFKLEMSRSIRRLKVVLAEGYDHFSAVYSIQTTEQ